MKELMEKLSGNKNVIGSIIAVVVFAAVSLLYFYPDVMEGNVLRQHDVQQGIAIGHEVKEYKDATGETSRWTNSLFSGMPTFQISPSYGSSAAVSVLSKVYSLGLPSPANLVFIMMLGFYILLLAVRTRWYVAILGAIAWGFSSYFFIIIGAGHIWKYVTLAYVPPTIAGIILAYRGKYLAGSVLAALFATLQLASNHVQMSYYFMFLIAGIVIAYLVQAVKGKKMTEWAKSTGVLVAAAVLAVLVNSPNLYNTYKYSKETMRGGHSELAAVADDANASSGGLDRDYITAWSYGGDELLTLLVPNAKGGANIKPEKGENKPLVLADTPEAKEMFNSGKIDAQIYQALGSFYQYFGDQPMTNGPVYIGVFVFALFIFGCIVVRGPLKWAILIVTILTVMLSLGRNMMWFTDLFIDYFPLYNKFRTVSSILVVAELTMPLLGIMGLQKMLDDKANIKAYVKPLLISFGVSGLLCLVLAIAPTMLIGNGFPEQEYSHYASQGLVAQYPQLFNAISNVRLGMVESDALRSLLILAAAFGIVMLYVYGKMNAKVMTGALVVLLLVDLVTVNKRYLNTDSFMAPAPMANQDFTPREVDLQILRDTTANYRVFDMQKFSEAMPSYFHKTIGGYHAAKLSRYQDMIEKHIGGEKGITPGVVNMLNAKYFILDEKTAQQNEGALGNAWFVDEVSFVDTPNEEIDALYDLDVANAAVADKKFADMLAGTIPAKESGDTIFEVSYAPNKLVYHYDKAADGVAVFSEVYFPWGWEATIDGAPADIARANYILRALRVPAGSHTVEFVFNPKSVTVTETLAYCAVAIIYIGLLAIVLLTFFGRKRNKESIDKQ